MVNQRKFATLVLRHKGEYFIDEIEVGAGATTEQIRDSLLERYGVRGARQQRLSGIVKATDRSSSIHQENFYFIYEAVLEIAPKKDVALKLVDTAPHRFIVNQIYSEKLSYHEIDIDIPGGEDPVDRIAAKRSCVIIGSYRKHFSQMQEAIKVFFASGVDVLSPKSGEVVNPESDFILLNYDPKILTEGEIQAVVLKKMDRASFTYLVNPGGYLGMSAAFEIGYGIANGILLLAAESVGEMHGQFISGIISPEDISRNWNQLFIASPE